MSRGPRVAIVAVVATLFAASLAAAGAAAPYPDGEVIQVTGLVTDGSGAPIPQVRLLLEASRRSFHVKKLRKVNANAVRVAARTDASGEYALDWKWHRYYNHFELSVVVGVRRPGGKEEVRVLASLDLSQRMKQGSPVVAAITVEDTTFLETYRAFLASLDTGDERQVFDAMGNPDKVEALRFPAHREESWWYFKMGRTYRFHDGALDEVVEFEPVTEF